MISPRHATEQGAGWPQGHGLAMFDVLDSTNEEARRRAEAGEAGPLWIMARRQTRGRGRRGRTWISEPGNLLCSLLLRPEGAAGDAARLSFAAALAARELLAACAPHAEIRLKWPNDVLMGGAKAAGILLESAAVRAGKLDWLAIGFGVNLAQAPEGLGREVTALARHLPPGAAPPAPEEALGFLAAAFGRWYERAREGFAPVRAEWLRHAAGLGEAVRVELGGRTLTGRFEGLDAEGALLLACPDGALRAIAAGEVYFSGTGGPSRVEDGHAAGN